MNLKTWAKDNGHTLNEAKEITGLDHWNAKVPDELIETESKQDTPIADAVVEVVEEVVDTVAEKVKEVVSSDVSKELIEASVRGAGSKSPYWNLRHLIGRD